MMQSSKRQSSFPYSTERSSTPLVTENKYDSRSEMESRWCSIIDGRTARKGLAFSSPFPFGSSSTFTGKHRVTLSSAWVRCSSSSPSGLRGPAIKWVVAEAKQHSHSTEGRAEMVARTLEGVTVADESALREGIKSIAVGKYGSKSLASDLIKSISVELKQLEELEQDHNPVDIELQYLRASFLGTLFMKNSLNEEEFHLLHKHTVLEHTRERREGRIRTLDGFADTVADGNGQRILVSAGHVLATVSSGSASNRSVWESNRVREFALRLLCDERLGEEDACELGGLLYASEEAVIDPVKVLIVHVMRVRHETEDELSGLTMSLREHTARLPRVMLSSRTGPGTGAMKVTKKYILMSEPFDGVVTWDLLTPLLANHLHMKYGFQVILPCGPSPGPKYGPNVLSLHERLQLNAKYGIVSRQGDALPVLSKWTAIRRLIVKRPALATVEKFVDPTPLPFGQAHIFIGSAFHPSYVEKMAFIAKQQNYRAFVIVSKGVEGSIGQSTSKVRNSQYCKALVGWRESKKSSSSDSNYATKYIYQLDEDDEHYGSSDLDTTLATTATPEKGQASVEDNANKILRYVQNGRSSGDNVFDRRVEVTCQLLDKAMALIQSNCPAMF